jgi:hypothetical protein
MGWKLDVHPDGTSQVTGPDGKIIRSHGPPTLPGALEQPYADDPAHSGPGRDGATPLRSG